MYYHNIKDLDKVYFIFGQTRAVADEEDIEARFIMDKM
jgi:hypothetical protein